MSLRKIAVLLAAGGLAVGLIGGGVGAVFTDQVQAIQHISVGTFSCVISDGGGGVLSNNNKTVTFSTFNITSSAAGSDPIAFTVKNTGSIGDVLTVSTTPVQNPPFSIIGMPFAAVPLAPGATHTYNTGVKWTALDNTNLGQQGDVTWTVNCGEAAAAGGTAIFDNHPATLPSNLPSFGVEAYYFNEWGSGVTFAGTERKLSTATVTMSSWACESGSWSANNCVSTPGHTYAAPITFNVYAVGSGNTVGALLATATQTFAIPYRPTASASCTGPDVGKWFDGSVCKNGLANNITFTFSGQTLPNNAIFGIAYNTSTNGYSPMGASNGGPLDSLNIATEPGTGVATAPLYAGSFLPDASHGYVANTSPATAFIGSGPATQFSAGDTFVGYQPAVQITATN